MNFRLYHREYAGRPRRVLWTLEEIGAPYEMTVMDYEQGMSDEHRARHPLSRVPALETDDGTIFETTAICLHLCDLHPEAGLLAEPGSFERALAYQWAVFGPAEMEPPGIDAAIHASSDPDRAKQSRAKFFKAMEVVADRLDGGYLVGGKFGVADILVGSNVALAKRAGFPEPMPPAIEEYVARLAERPAYQRAMERDKEAQPTPTA